MSSWPSRVLIAHSGKSSAWEVWLEVKALHNLSIYVCRVFTEDIIGSRCIPRELELSWREEPMSIDLLLFKGILRVLLRKNVQTRRDIEDSISFEILQNGLDATKRIKRIFGIWGESQNELKIVDKVHSTRVSNAVL